MTSATCRQGPDQSPCCLLQASAILLATVKVLAIKGTAKNMTPSWASLLTLSRGVRWHTVWFDPRDAAMKPQWQAQLNSPSRSTHAALAGQLWVLRRHSLMLRLHLGPSMLQAEGTGGLGTLARQAGSVCKARLCEAGVTEALHLCTLSC